MKDGKPYHGVFCYLRVPGAWWFRVFGFGIKAKDTDRHPLLFSERVRGHGWQIGKWRFGILTPRGI